MLFNFSFMENFLDTGTITIYAGTSDQKVCELADVVTQEINKLGHLVTHEELERAKAQTKASIVMGLESLTKTDVSECTGTYCIRAYSKYR